MLDFTFILYVLFGSVAGLFVGALPGLSVTMATALLLSLTYTWPASYALGTMMGVYVVGVYAGAISAILVNVPGAPASVVTTLDGYAMTQRGESRKALLLAVYASCMGSLAGFALLALALAPMSRVALLLRPLDSFLLACLGLFFVGRLRGEKKASPMGAYFAATLGLLLSRVGTDPLTGVERLTLGLSSLQAGIPLVPALIGLFGVAEVFLRQGQLGSKKPATVEGSAFLKKNPADSIKKESYSALLWKQRRNLLLSSLLGGFIGALPGAGAPVASFFAYSEARRRYTEADPPFGQGATEGLLAGEAANNACIGGAFIPLLALAIPGDAVTAVLLAAFRIHGLRPGPLFLQESPEVFRLLLVGGLLATAFLFLLGRFLVPKLRILLRLPEAILLPLILLLCVLGAYAQQERLVDLWMMLAFAVLALFLRRHRIPIAPLVLGLVLGDLMETSLRRALSLAAAADQPLRQLFLQPTTLCLLVLFFLLGFWPRLKAYFGWRR